MLSIETFVLEMWSNSRCNVYYLLVVHTLVWAAKESVPTCFKMIVKGF